MNFSQGLQIIDLLGGERLLELQILYVRNSELREATKFETKFNHFFCLLVVILSDANLNGGLISEHLVD
jgi:hypothetical protein